MCKELIKLIDYIMIEKTINNDPVLILAGVISRFRSK